MTILANRPVGVLSRPMLWVPTPDRGKPLPDERLVSCEDPADVMKLITAARLALFRAVKEMPGSITQISQRLHRDRRAVKRDVDELARAGWVSVGRGLFPACVVAMLKMKMVGSRHAPVKGFRLEMPGDSFDRRNDH